MERHSLAFLSLSNAYRFKRKQAKIAYHAKLFLSLTTYMVIHYFRARFQKNRLCGCCLRWCRVRSWAATTF